LSGINGKNILFIQKMNNVIVLLPGGFKPPHVGHLALANAYAEKSEVSSVVVMVGPKERDGITREQSLAVWGLLPKNPKVKVVSIPFENPMQAAYEFVFSMSPNTKANVSLAASSKGGDDKRTVDFVTNINGVYKTIGTKAGQKVPVNVNAVRLDVGVAPTNYSGRTDGNVGGISASVLRKDISGRDFNNFKTNYIGVSNNTIGQIYKTFTQNMNINENVKRLIKKILSEDFDGDIRALTKKRDALEYEIEKIKLNKDEDALSRAGENQKNMESTGGDVDAARNQVEAAKKAVDSAKKRLAAANVKKSA